MYDLVNKIHALKPQKSQMENNVLTTSHLNIVNKKIPFSKIKRVPMTKTVFPRQAKVKSWDRFLIWPHGLAYSQTFS